MSKTDIKGGTDTGVTKKYLIKKPPTSKTLYALVYDIKTKQMTDPGRTDSSPAFYVPVDSPCRPWFRTKFYTVLIKELRALGYHSTQLSKHTKECTQEQALADAYSLHTLPTLAPWIQFCMKKLHVVKLVTEESIYPLNFIEAPQYYPAGDDDDGYPEEDDDFIEEDEDAVADIIEQLEQI